MKKTEKHLFVENLTEELKDASGVVLVDYTGLTVAQQQDLKKRLSEVGANLRVVKNTLFKLAGEKAKAPKEVVTDTVLTGPTAIVLAKEDPIAPLQVLHKFAEEFEIPNLKVGMIEGSFKDKTTLEKIAQLPGREVLYGQVVGSIASPMHGLVFTLNSKMRDLVYILEKASKKSQ